MENLICKFFKGKERMPIEDQEYWTGLCLLILARIKSLDISKTYTIEKILSEEHWDSISKGDHKTLGKYVYQLSAIGALPLHCDGINKSHTCVYEIIRS